MRALVVALIALASPTAARAEDMEGNLVYIPLPSGEALAVNNPLGRVQVRGWDQPQVRIVATKRAQSAALLDRLKVRVNLEDGKLDVSTGFYFSDGKWRPLPQAGAAIDLVIDAPRQMALTAGTFSGDLDAEGFRAGARLSSKAGEIRAVDIEGPVDTHSLAGRQSLQSIRGRLAADGVEGDLELASVDGDTIDARVARGQITAREVRTPVVRLSATVGTIVFIGALRPGGRYELSTHEGDVRLVLRPAPFRVVARSGVGRVVSGFRVVGEAQPGLLRGEHDGGGASLELASATGEVSLKPAP